MRHTAMVLIVATAAGAAWIARPCLQPVPAVVAGQVLGPSGPIAAAQVRIRATRSQSTTDAAGRFHLPQAANQRVTASAPGFIIAGTQASAGLLSLRLSPLPARDNPHYVWVDPAPNPSVAGNCGNCHTQIYREWAASGHAHSAAGRHFRELYEGSGTSASWGLLRQYPDGAGVCTACHAPAIAESDPAYFDLRRLQGTARAGVHCDYCHKVTGPADGPLGLAHGRFGLRLLRPTGSGQLFFGPLDDVDRGEDAYSAFYHDSRYCASCHEGTLFGVHVYSTYSEWLQSPARQQGRQCQDCHMASSGTMTNVAPGHGGIQRNPRTLSNHVFFAGDQATMLRNCLRVHATLTQLESGVRVKLTVSVEGAGHRIPTGLPDHHLILVALGRDTAGRPVPSREGPRLPALAGPQLSGQPGRVYAKLLHDLDGRPPAPFWAAATDPKDNRLLPGQADHMEMLFPAEVAEVRIRLLYRRFWDEVARQRQWTDNDIVVYEKSLTVHR